ncbi:Ada3 domain-containing protein [Aureliella helgolandensis]|uniref:Uncharacterized protein n=1 Tax=Aureliella helgolandensis TaxID=2527968 RepID=A0A518G2Q8_9BACT|nr:hypothetical protein [Aureliella helgolandensis]QDV22874.1 hypothetical protein Q31a_11670 [Aureliella helgolandensis]
MSSSTSARPVKILGDCVCGGNSDSPNFDCERCKLVYCIVRAAELRRLQTEFATTDNHNVARQALTELAKCEERFDRLLSRFALTPEAHLTPEAQSAAATSLLPGQDSGRQYYDRE